MKLFKRSITGMSVGIVCIYGGFAMLVMSLFMIFGTLAGVGGIYGFFADTRFSGVSLAIFGMWTAAAVLLVGGVFTAFGFWVAGLVALSRTEAAWYMAVEAAGFLVCFMLAGTTGLFLSPAIWWAVHFAGYRTACSKGSSVQ